MNFPTEEKKTHTTKLHTKQSQFRETTLLFHKHQPPCTYTLRQKPDAVFSIVVTRDTCIHGQLQHAGRGWREHVTRLLYCRTVRSQKQLIARSVQALLHYSVGDIVLQASSKTSTLAPQSQHRDIVSFLRVPNLCHFKFGELLAF